MRAVVVLGYCKAKSLCGLGRIAAGTKVLYILMIVLLLRCRVT